MSAYSTTWRRRAAISAPNTAGGATKDVDTVIPKEWDEFWDVINSTGSDIRVTAADGRTLLNYSIDDGSGGTFDATNRLGRIRIDGATVPGTATEVDLFWLYFDPTSTQASAAVATTITSALTGYIERGMPRSHVCDVLPPRPGLTTPIARFGKDSSSEIDLWFRLSDLEGTRQTIAGRRLLEEPMAATYAVYDTVPAAQAGMIDTTLMRWVEHRRGLGREMWLKVRVKSGTSGSTYTVKPTILTTVPNVSGTHRTLVGRAGIRVYDVLET